VLSLACAAAQTSAAAAQDAAPSAPVEGWVVDAGTGAPITGAEVWAQGSAPAYTDADGFFSLGTMPAGERTLRAEHLTHAPRETALPFGEGHPRPRIALESDTAKARRLGDVRTMLRRDRRRGAQFYRVVERDELLTMSAEELHARARTLIPFGGPCELAPNTGRCLGSDGPLLVIDDDIAGMRMRHLEGLEPASLYVVELFPDRRLVHAYTVAFIARAMDSPALLLRARRTPR
jgi:hypothetical protein